MKNTILKTGEKCLRIGFLALFFMQAHSIIATAATLPVLSEVHHGKVDAQVRPDGKTMDIYTGPGSNAAVFSSFDSSTGTTVNINQEAPDSRTLANVIGDATHFSGSLNLNQGDFYLVNPEGVFFHEGSAIDVGMNAQFVVAAARVEMDAYMKGNPVFSQTGAGVYRNEGTIYLQESGLFGAIGRSVTQDGAIIGTKSRGVHMIAGDGVYVEFSGNDIVGFKSKTPASSAKVHTTADSTTSTGGGPIYMTANTADSIVRGVVHVEGYLESGGSEVTNGGDIVFTAPQGGIIVDADAVVDTSAKHAGDISVRAPEIVFKNGAVFNVSGGEAGTIEIGGLRNINGDNPLDWKLVVEQEATSIHIAEGAKFYARRYQDSGRAGRVFMVAQDDLDFQGTIHVEAKGGGDAPIVEASQRKGKFRYSDVPTDRIHLGKTGKFIFDPDTIDVGVDDAAAIAAQLVNNDVILMANQRIAINSPITSTGNGTLLLAVMTDILSGAEVDQLRFGANINLNGTGNLLLYQENPLAAPTFAGGAEITSNTANRNYVLFSVPNGSGLGAVVSVNNVSSFVVQRRTAGQALATVEPVHYTEDIIFPAHVPIAAADGDIVTAFNVVPPEGLEAAGFEETGGDTGIFTGGTIGQNTLTIQAAGDGESSPLFSELNQNGDYGLVHATPIFDGNISLDGGGRVGAIAQSLQDPGGGAVRLFADRLGD